RLVASSSRSAVTFVSLRTMSPSQSFRASRNSGGASPGRFSTVKPAERSGPRPLSLTSSATNIFVVIMKAWYGNSATKRHTTLRHKKAQKTQNKTDASAFLLLHYISFVPFVLFCGFPGDEYGDSCLSEGHS